MLAALCHSAKTGWSEVQDLSEMSELRVQDDNLLWAEADVSNLTQEDVDLIAEEFDLDPLAVEDAMHTRQRPKFEDYPSHTFIVFHELQDIEDQLEAVQLACFIGSQFMLTLHDGADRTITEAKRRWGEGGDQPPRDAADLLHTLLDVVVDDYQDFADKLESDVESIEEIVLDDPHLPVQRQLYTLKQRVSRLRRYALPAARVMDWALGEDRLKPLSRNTRSLFRDVHDHLLRIKDQIHNIDELNQAVLDLTRAARGDAIGEISKKLTAYAAIFAVLTLIAGVYGMNFELVPASGEVFGFWFALALMAVTSIGLYIYFKKRGWI